jgi:anthranilate phosphoribosyltransferase
MSLEQHGGWPAILETVVTGADLTSDAAGAAMESILGGAATAAQIAAFVVAMRAKGETVEELVGMVDAMQAAAVPLELPPGTIDIVGMGGSPARRAHAVNVSTMACFVAAGAGAVVCKHGNRKASSTSGAFDLLEALGLPVELSASQVAACVDKAGIGFAFARTFHPAMRHAAPVRAELGIASIFNYIGLLSHPGRVTRQVIGVSVPALMTVAADVLAARGADRAMVVHGFVDLDELSTAGPNDVVEVRGGAPTRTTVDARDLGLARPPADGLVGGDAATNAAIATSVFAGEAGPYRDLVALNAAAGLVVAGLADDLAGGLNLANDSLDSGAAAATLERLRDVLATLA